VSCRTSLCSRQSRRRGIGVESERRLDGGIAAEGPGARRTRTAAAMGIPQRLRIIVPGGVIAVIAAVVGARTSLSSFLPAAGPNAAVRYIVSTVFAPVFFLVPGMRSWAGETVPTPAYMSVVAVVAIVALPSHAILPRRSTAVLTVVGLAAWMFCELLLVVGAA